MKKLLLMVALVIALKIALGLPITLMLCLIIIGAGLPILKENDNRWARRIAAIVGLTYLLINGTHFLNTRLPVTASLNNHTWLGWDVLVANKITDPMAKGKATLLEMLTARDDDAAKHIKTLVAEGRLKEAVKYYQEREAESKEVRAVIDGKYAEDKPTSIEKKSLSEPTPASVPISAPAPAPEPKKLTKVCIGEPQRCNDAEKIALADNTLDVVMLYDGGKAHFTGTKKGACCYVGNWDQTSSVSKGNFETCKNPDGTFTGWHSSVGYEGTKPFNII